MAKVELSEEETRVMELEVERSVSELGNMSFGKGKEVHDLLFTYRELVILPGRSHRRRGFIWGTLPRASDLKV
jgi:hypothetical protein